MATRSYIEVDAAHTDNERLLYQHKAPRGRGRQWSTCQLIWISFLVAFIVGITSNLDRIVAYINDSNSPSSASSSSDIVWPTSFGHGIYEYFPQNTSFTDFNWGSYGGSPLIIHELQQQLQLDIAACTACFFLSDKYELQSDVLQLLADYMNIANSSDLVFVDNASHGVNAILKALMQNVYEGHCGVNHTKTNQTCKFLMFQTAYQMVPETFKWIDASKSAKGEDIVLTFPVSLAAMRNTSILLQDLQQFIVENTNEQSRIYLAVVSHITAWPAAIYDAKAIMQLLRKHNILGLIDGAHSLGQLEVDIQDMDPDFFVGTGYKWMYAPLSSGCLYVRHELQPHVVPTTISNLGSGDTAFQKQFSYSGTMDYSAWISMKYALEFRRNITQNIGSGQEHEISDYTHNLVLEGGRLVASIWNTSLLIEEEDKLPSMVNIVLPSQNPMHVSLIFAALNQAGFRTRGGPPYGGIWFVRLSAQIFLELSDFEDLAYVALSALPLQ